MHWLVAGLGNPGREYARTRHNVGFLVVERLAAEARAVFLAGEGCAEVATAEWAGVPVVLLKPQTFMNLCGPCVAGWLDRLGLVAGRLVVAHDDLDLPLGRLRVVGSAGPGGHRGVASIQAVLGTQGFCRVRVGIGRPPEDEGAADRVLREFLPEELPLVARTVVRAAAAVRSLICEGLTPAMDRYNPWTAPEVEGSV